VVVPLEQLGHGARFNPDPLGNVVFTQHDPAANCRNSLSSFDSLRPSRVPTTPAPGECIFRERA
jgi:hypothetical protein